MNPPIVQLDHYELLEASMAGIRRHIHNVFRGNGHGLPNRDDWNIDITGACGELVVSKFFNRYWRPVVRDPWTDLRSDVGKSLNVRTTEHPNGHLIVHKNDPDEGVYILVTGRNLTWTIPGWLLGWEAKQDGWWDTRLRSPAYFVPQEALHPISKLAIT